MHPSREISFTLGLYLLLTIAADHVHKAELVALASAQKALVLPEDDGVPPEESLEAATKEPPPLSGVLNNGATAPKSTDYCNVYECGSNHIACNSTRTLSVRCSKGARVVDLTEDNKALILKLHNDIRNEVAGGEMELLEPAARMAEMVWDDELAELARLNVLTCVLRTDKCRATERFRYAGQNIAMFSYAGEEEDIKDEWLINDRFQAWINESEHINMDIIRRYPGEHAIVVGHFTIIVADKNSHIGCAALRSFDEGFNRFMLTCNYAITNIVGRSTYTVGKPASRCSTGPSPTYPFLCSTGEAYDNKSF